MTIKLTFEFQTFEEASTFLGRHVTPTEAPKPKAAKKAATAPVVTAAPVGVESPTAEQGQAAPLPEPVKATPKVPNAPVQAVAKIDEAAVRAALRDVVNNQSMKAAAEILKQFGATSISQIKPEQYADFIKACQK